MKGNACLTRSARVLWVDEHKLGRKFCRRTSSATSYSLSPSSTYWSSSSWTSSWQRWQQHSWQDNTWSEQWCARQPRTRVWKEVEQASRKLVRADSERQAQRCHHQPESPHSASSSRECEGRCEHHHTHLFARRRTFSRAPHSAQFMQHWHFSNVVTPHWLKMKGSLCHLFVYNHFLSSLTCPRASAHWSGRSCCFDNPTPNTTPHHTPAHTTPHNRAQRTTPHSTLHTLQHPHTTHLTIHTNLSIRDEPTHNGCEPHTHTKFPLHGVTCQYNMLSERSLDLVTVHRMKHAREWVPVFSRSVPVASDACFLSTTGKYYTRPVANREFFGRKYWAAALISKTSNQIRNIPSILPECPTILRRANYFCCFLVRPGPRSQQ